MKVFCKWIDKTPEELIEEAEDEIDNGVRIRKRNIKKYFI